jgi:hypothetical protein
MKMFEMLGLNPKPLKFPNSSALKLILNLPPFEKPKWSRPRHTMRGNLEASGKENNILFLKKKPIRLLNGFYGQQYHLGILINHLFVIDFPSCKTTLTNNSCLLETKSISLIPYPHLFLVKSPACSYHKL